MKDHSGMLLTWLLIIIFNAEVPQVEHKCPRIDAGGRSHRASGQLNVKASNSRELPQQV